VRAGSGARLVVGFSCCLCFATVSGALAQGFLSDGQNQKKKGKEGKAVQREPPSALHPHTHIQAGLPHLPAALSVRADASSPLSACFWPSRSLVPTSPASPSLHSSLVCPSRTHDSCGRVSISMAASSTTNGGGGCLELLPAEVGQWPCQRIFSCALSCRPRSSFA
jgi:hypothetical protein